MIVSVIPVSYSSSHYRSSAQNTSPLRAMVMTYTPAKVEGQQSFISKVDTDGDDYITFVANAVSGNV